MPVSVAVLPTRREIQPDSRGASISLCQVLADRWELLDAWYRVARAGGAPGPDGVTVGAFAMQLDRRVDDLSASISAGRYRPGPIARQFLPKSDGGTRAIGIANVADRLLQTAAGQWLQRRLEPSFVPNSFGYRAGMGPQRAAMFAAGLAANHLWVVTADIEKFFDNVDHSILARLLDEAAVCPADCALLLSWLKATPLDRGAPLLTVKGLPQGLPISPPLANLYLHDFDTCLRVAGRAHARFADDFVVFARTETDAVEAHRWMAGYLGSQRHLKLKSAKTAIVPVASGFDFVGIRIDGKALRLTAAAPGRFKAEVIERLSGLAGNFTAAVKEVNDLVRGWRAYYGHLSSEMALELVTLDAWRREQVTMAIVAAGQTADTAGVLFESLCVDPIAMVAGAYGPGQPSVEPQNETIPVSDQRTFRQSPPRDRTVRELAIGLKQRPWLTDSGDLVVPTHGAFITRAGQTLIVKRKKQTLLEVPLNAVKHVAVIGLGVALSSAAVAGCVTVGIRIWLVDRLGRTLGHFTPARAPVHARVGRLLLLAGRTRQGTTLAKGLLKGKLGNQRALLLYYAKAPSRPQDVRTALRVAAASIRASLGDLRSVDGPIHATRQALFLVEARAAAAYWSAFARLVPAPLGFPGRLGRGATDPVNALLNYGYHKLLHLVWEAIDRMGLVPWLGVLHTGRRRSPALVLDLMEEFRPVAVDRVVLGLLGRGFLPRQRPDSRLRLSTITTFERAWATNLRRPFAANYSLERTLRAQVGVFRRALEDRCPYCAVVMTW